MAFSSHTQMENTGRLWLTRELELMDADAFVETVEEASAEAMPRPSTSPAWWPKPVLALRRGDRASRRPWQKPRSEINLPERTQALETSRNQKS